jgi:hypothetical protein
MSSTGAMGRPVFAVIDVESTGWTLTLIKTMTAVDISDELKMVTNWRLRG